MTKKLLITPIILGLATMAAHANAAAGKTAYVTCSACHNPDGKGLPIGDKKMAPSLVDSKVATGDPSVLALVILKGIKKEGTDYIGIMAPLEAVYADDKKLADVMTYVRQSFGNKASAVTAEDAAKYRAKWKDVKEPVTRAKLAELAK
ncbi:MAG: cytochrome c [Verrucomicrobiae bacterium]|nr:cytochrome c [Verrucomicrobiae bacterium]NNJ85992.1 cytochrome c [Akkermansiaceae bacterium]